MIVSACHNYETNYNWHKHCQMYSVLIKKQLKKHRSWEKL